MATTYSEQDRQIIADCVSNKRTTLKAAFKKAARILHRKPAGISAYYYAEMKTSNDNGLNDDPLLPKPQKLRQPVNSPLLTAVKSNALRLAKLLVDQLTAAENLALFEYMLEREKLGTETAEKPNMNPAPLE